MSDPILTDKQHEELLQHDLGKIAAMPAGARILRWLIYDLGALEQPSWSTDPLLSARIEGNRHVGREVMNALRKIDNEQGTQHFRRVYEARFGRTGEEEKDHG